MEKCGECYYMTFDVKNEKISERWKKIKSNDKKRNTKSSLMKKKEPILKRYYFNKKISLL